MIKGSITAKPQVFAAAVKWAAKFVAGKPVAPIQGGLHLVVAGGRLTIEAFNENVSARAVVPVDGDGEGSATVSGRLLAELVSTFPDKTVELSGDVAYQELLTITAGRWKGTLPVMDADAFPELAAAPSVIGSVSGEAFADLIARVVPAASTDLNKQIAMACAFLTFGDVSVSAIASDSLRVAGSEITFLPNDGTADYLGEAPATALVLAQTMDDVAAAFIGPDEIAVGLDDHSLSLTSATRSVVLRQIGEPGPDRYPAEPVLRKHLATEHPHHALVKTADLLGPMKRAALVRAKDGPIKLAFGPDTISVFAKADDIHQDSAEEVDATYSGPEHAAAFNPKYLGDALASAPGGEVDLAFRPTGPGERPATLIVSVPGNEAWRHLLMPIRVN